MIANYTDFIEETMAQVAAWSKDKGIFIPDEDNHELADRLWAKLVIPSIVDCSEELNALISKVGEKYSEVLSTVIVQRGFEVDRGRFSCRTREDGTQVYCYDGEPFIIFYPPSIGGRDISVSWVAILDFDTWSEVNGDNLSAEMAETGADRELDFDQERWLEKRYDLYRKEVLREQ